MADLSLHGSNSSKSPRIVVRGMLDDKHLRNPDEDWTGKTSTAERRKLQNRLNQRRRRAQAKALLLTQKETPSEAPSYDKRTNENSTTSVIALSPCLLLPNMGINNQGLSTHPYKKVEQCMHPVQWKLIRQAVNATPPNTTYESFNTFNVFSMQSEPIHHPVLPVDQILLPLFHFNLIRGLFQNMHLLGLDPTMMAEDILSPFCLHSPNRRPHLASLLPPDLQPTTTQKLVPHHPELDILPFPAIRDAFIHAKSKYNEFDLCRDLIFGVERTPFEDDGVIIGDGTGLRVWNDPWCAESWEVEERFAWKYRDLLCEGLLRSTNKWRDMRGEKPLDFELGKNHVPRIYEV